MQAHKANGCQMDRRKEENKKGGLALLDFYFLPSFLFGHPPLPLINFKLDILKVPSVTIAWRAPGAACNSCLGVPPFKMMVFWFFINNGVDNAQPAKGTENVPSVASSKEQMSRRMRRFAPMVGTRKRRRKAMGFIF